MPFLYSLRRALPAAVLFTSIASAQSCYYPDGQTLSEDLPCDSTAADSACCPSNSFCLSGGLCVAGAVVSRGSCTDQTWGSPACAGYCQTVGPNAEVAITPCSTDTDSNTFACGLSGDCSRDTFTVPVDTSLSLRPSQIAALVGTLSAASGAPSDAACAGADAESLFTTGQMAGVGIGVGLPLALALLIALFMLRREKRRFSKPKLMYKLPDDLADTRENVTALRPPPPMHPAMRPDSAADNASAYSSRRNSFRTAAASPALSPRPKHTGTFMERYESMKKSPDAREANHRHELESSPPYYEVERHEMGDYRRSVSSQTTGRTR